MTYRRNRYRFHLFPAFAADVDHRPIHRDVHHLARWLNHLAPDDLCLRTRYLYRCLRLLGLPRLQPRPPYAFASRCRLFLDSVTCVNSFSCLAARPKGISLHNRNACAIVPGDQLSCSINSSRRSRGKNPLPTPWTEAMRSLHLHVPFGMDHRARTPPIRFRLLPALWTGYLLVPPIPMLQQQLP